MSWMYIELFALFGDRICKRDYWAVGLWAEPQPRPQSAFPWLSKARVKRPGDDIGRSLGKAESNTDF